jgi:hypothetical protein
MVKTVVEVARYHPPCLSAINNSCIDGRGLSAGWFRLDLFLLGTRSGLNPNPRKTFRGDLLIAR